MVTAVPLTPQQPTRPPTAPAARPLARGIQSLAKGGSLRPRGAALAAWRLDGEEAVAALLCLLKVADPTGVEPPRPRPLSLQQLGARVEAGAVCSALTAATLTSEQQVRAHVLHICT